MSWWQFSLACRAAELEQVESLLLELGAQSLSLADAGDEPIYEPLPGDNPVWRESIVTATFDGRLDPESLQQAILSALPEHLAPGLQRRQLDEQDWEQSYRNHFRPIEIAVGLWIVPSWCKPPRSDAISIRLDPGLAFGTGSHPTTAMCLAWLADNDIRGLGVIDYGCGSGILAIAACKLGARRVLAVDIDPQALGASRDNFELNQIPTQQWQLAPVDDMPPFEADLLLANILAGPLLELAPQLAARVVSGGQIVLSGILKPQLKEIQSGYAKFFVLDPPDCREDWVCISGRRI